MQRSFRLHPALALRHHHHCCCCSRYCLLLLVALALALALLRLLQLQHPLVPEQAQEAVQRRWFGVP